MGRLPHETTIQHFSHPHPLHLSSSSDHQHHNALIPISCAACTLPCSSSSLVSPYIYTCRPCSFHLHAEPCSRLPPLIHHPCHPTHTLHLLPRPTYPEGYFDCDACGRTGSGFSYHCPACSVDLHSACASAALSIHLYAHPHPLTLTFAPPYDSKGFSCDVCRSPGGNHWLYRCALCEFDVHLGCAAGGAAGLGQAGRSVSLSISSQGRVVAHPQVQQPVGVSRMGSTGGLMRLVAGGIIDGASQQIGQNLANGFMGGGGGGGGGGDGGGSSILDIGGTILGSVLGGDSSS